VFERTAPGGVPTWTNTAFLTVAEAANDDRLGADVAISGDTIIAGATNRDIDGLGNAGAAYVFVRDGQGGWVEQGRLEVPDPVAGDSLGAAVAVSGDTVVAGATGRDNPGGATDQGGAFVFSRLGDRWIPPKKRLDTTPLADGDEMGFSVAMDGDFAVVGLPGFDDGARMSAGAIRIFQRDGSRWIEVQEIVDPTGFAFARYGESVAIDGSYIVVGAPGTQLDRGTAYVYQRNFSTGVWDFDGTLFNTSPDDGDRYGAAVDISTKGGTRSAIVGAPGDDDSFTDDGTVAIYRRDGGGWSFEILLSSFDAQDGGRFGHAVSIDGDRAAVGAPDENVPFPGVSDGRVYVFHRFSEALPWAFRNTVDQPPDDDVFDFGEAVRLQGDTLLVGAPGFIDGPTSNSGGAYVYRLDDSVVTLEATLVPNDGFGGNWAGGSVALDGDLALLGSVRGADGGGIGRSAPRSPAPPSSSPSTTPPSSRSP